MSHPLTPRRRSRFAKSGDLTRDLALGCRLGETKPEPAGTELPVGAAWGGRCRASLGTPSSAAPPGASHMPVVLGCSRPLRLRGCAGRWQFVRVLCLVPASPPSFLDG